MTPSVAKLVAALAGRSIAEATTRPHPADPAEAGQVAALTAQLAASQGEVRRLLGLLQAREKAHRATEEDLLRLRAANGRLADQRDAARPMHPTGRPDLRDPDEALVRQAEQDRRNARLLDARLAVLEGRA